jgi:hypothetical protein
MQPTYYIEGGIGSWDWTDNDFIYLVLRTKLYLKLMTEQS